MKKLVIYGTGSFAQLMKWYIDNDDNREIIAFTVEEKYCDKSEFEGLPVISFEHILDKYPPEVVEILMGIGYDNMNDTRKRIFEECKKKGYHVAQYIHSSARLSNTELGEGNIILEDTLVEPFAKIGNCNLIWCKISIAHNCIIGDFNTIAGMASVCGFAEIKNNCFIGNSAVVRDKKKVADYTLIGAAAYAADDTIEGCVIAANKGVVLLGKNSKDFL